MSEYLLKQKNTVKALPKCLFLVQVFHTSVSPVVGWKQRCPRKWCSNGRGSPQKGTPPWLWGGAMALSQDVKMSKGTPVTAGLMLAPLSVLQTWCYWWVSKQRALLSSQPQGLQPVAQKLWPRLKRRKCLVNWDSKLVVRDWEAGGWLQCLASPSPCSLTAHAVVWASPTFSLPCVFSPLVRTCSATF